MTTTNPKSNQTTILAVIIGLLLLVCIFLTYKYTTLSKANATMTTQNSELTQLKEELNDQYYEALSELEEMRGSNEELNTLVEKQKEDLKKQKAKIDDLLRDSRNLSAARKELNGLKGKVEQYLAEINQLRQEVEVLTSENSQLSDANQALSTDLNSQRMANEELSAQKATLSNQKAQLEQVKAQLAKKVNIASVIKVEELEADGVRLRGSGKPVRKTRASNVEQIRVCFNTVANNVADSGTETFVLRLIGPDGETLAMDNMGSGVFVNNATNSEMRYTKMQDMDYDQDAGNMCMYWNPGIPFNKGNYTVEVYNKGYLTGTTTLRLR